MSRLEKVLNVLKSIFWGLLLVIAVTMITFYALGYRFLAIETASMEPTYSVGTLIVTQQVDPDTVQVGDTISFTVDDNLTLVTHRVVSINKEQRFFHTKGDNNNVEDSPVYFDNLYGKVSFDIPFIGCIVLLANTDIGKLIFVCFVLFLIAVSIGFKSLIKIIKFNREHNG